MSRKDTICFTLYYRENCHLCESMRLALVRLQKKVDFTWTEIDIDRDTQLIYQFDTLIPVLHFNGIEICHYFIDEKAILERISA